MNQKIKIKKFPLRKVAGLVVLFTFFSCSHTTSQKENDTLFSGFVEPPAGSRPFVRWWWNGNCLEKDEIARQLDVLHKAGIGGVEINPVAMPEEAADIGVKPLTWLKDCPGWNEMLQFATPKAKKRGMVADLIVGSG
jgi:hypothetical protein